VDVENMVEEMKTALGAADNVDLRGGGFSKIIGDQKSQSVVGQYVIAQAEDSRGRCAFG
jgi:hypothetical protein